MTLKGCEKEIGQGADRRIAEKKNRHRKQLDRRTIEHGAPWVGESAGGYRK
jgi:hypothetical protein